MVTSEIGRSTGGRDGAIAVTNTLSATVATFTSAVLLISIFTSGAWGHPGPRVAASEEPAETGLTLCGAVATASRGVLQTPRFPNAFPVPLRCTWVIDASTGHAPGSSILVRLTQVFVAGGLRFESFSRLDVSPVSEGRPWWFVGRQKAGRIPSEGRQLIFDSDFGSSPPLEEVAWIRTASPYLVATLSIESLEGSHIRDLGALLDLYGLNMTYQVVSPPKGDSGAAGGRRRQGGGVKGRRRGGKAGGGGGLSGSCSLLGCSVAGHCLANHDLSRYYCSCFKGHFGRRCQYSRECNPMKNVSRCYNGGKCRHVGSTAIRCECPKGFHGPLCEGRHPVLGRKNPDSRSGGRESERRGQKNKMKGSRTTSGTKDCPDCLGFQCNYDGSPESTCKCQPGYKVHKGDRWLFEGTFKIANFTARPPAGPKLPNGTIEELLEKQLARCLRRQNVSHLSRARIGKVSEDGEVSYTFVVGEDDGSRVRGALGVLVREIQHQEEFPLSPDSLNVHQGPALLLLEVALDTGSVAPGGGYTASCVAQGSPAMEFRWYKDGDLIDHTKASRHMWQRLLPDDRPDIYTAILRVTAASAPEDMGVLWCHVSDRGRQQCGHVIVVEARGPHRGAYVRPRSSTILRGGNLTLACTSPASVMDGGTDQDDEFSWTKDGTPLVVMPGKEVVEPLYPSGSLLRIYNAQQSAMYTCHVATNASSQGTSLPSKLPNIPLSGEGKNDVSSHVAVTDPVDPMCPQETSWDVEWPYTAVGQRAAVECPMVPSSSFPETLNGHVKPTSFQDHPVWGHTPVGNAWVTFNGPEATRLCSGAAKWEIPDFSHCDYEPVTTLHKKFRRLTLGYSATSPEQTLQKVLDWLYSGGSWLSSNDGPSSDKPSVPLGPSQSLPSPILFPGQIRKILHLLEEVQYYLYDRTVVNDNYLGGIDMDTSSCNVLKILDFLLLKHQVPVSDPEVSTHLIHLAHQQSVIWAHSVDPEFLGYPVQYPTSSSNMTTSDPTTTSNSLFVFMESVSDDSVRIPMPGQSIPLWLSEHVKVSLFTRAPTLVDVLLQPEKTTMGDVPGNMSIDPRSTLFTLPQPPENFLFHMIAFRNIGTSIPVKNRKGDSRNHPMEYQLASHVVSIDLYHQHGRKHQPGFMKSFLKSSKDSRESIVSMRAEGSLNLTLHFYVAPQGIAEGFQKSHQDQVACGHLTEGQMATTYTLTSSWDVGPALSSSGSMVTCHFENSGTYAAFIIGQKLGNPTGHIFPTDVDLEGRNLRSEEWWTIFNGNHRSGGKTILGIGFGICFALCLLTILKNAIATTSTWQKVQKKAPENLPTVERPSFSGQRGNDDGSHHPRVFKSKKIAAASEGKSIPLDSYLQMQCCITVLIAMGFFSYGCLLLSPQSSQPFITMGLEISLLTGMASLMGVVLIMYSEVSVESRVMSVVPQSSAAHVSMICVGSCSARGSTAGAPSITPSKKNSLPKVCWVGCCKMNKFQNLPHPKLLIAGITSGVPIVSVLVLDLIQRICSSSMQPSWWLTIESSHFGIFLSLAIIISLLFLPVSANMLQELCRSKSHQEGQVDGVVREKENEKKSTSSLRIEVLRRTVAIFSIVAVMEIASIIYINFPDSLVAQWIFSISSLLLMWKVCMGGPNPLLSMAEIWTANGGPCMISHQQKPWNSCAIKCFCLALSLASHPQHSLPPGFS